MSHGLNGGNFVAHQANCFRARTDENKAALLRPLCEIRILGRKAVARMNSYRVRDLGGADHGWDIQIAVGRRRWTDADGFIGQAHVLEIPVSGRMHSDRLNAEFTTRPQDAKCNLSSVGDDNLLKHRQSCPAQRLVDDEDGLAVLDRLPVLHQYGFDLARRVSLNLVENLHGLDDTQDIPDLHTGTHFYEGFGTR